MKFCVLSAQPRTPWGQEHLKEFSKDYIFVTSKWQADVWVADKEFVLTEALEESIQLNRRKPKFCLLWTSEPYYSETAQKQKTIYGVQVHILNLWNGRALFHNGHFLEGKEPEGLKPPPPPRPMRAEGRPVVALMTYPNTLNPFTKERVTIAKEGHGKGLVDIYGKGWPDSVRKGNSREGEWWTSKMPILDQYDYNLALENCIKPFYVSEKIWDPITRHCLPIYAENGTIYRDFPRHSFLDIRDYRTTEKLWEHIESMSTTEWNDRFNMCWEGLQNGWKCWKEKGWSESLQEIEKVVQEATK